MLILAMVEHDGLPAGSTLRQIAQLKNVIAVVEAVGAEVVDLGPIPYISCTILGWHKFEIRRLERFKGCSAVV